MDIILASITWDGPVVDILRVFAEPAPDAGVEVHDDCVVMFRSLDAEEEPTGDVTGVEIVSFLSYDLWDDLPTLPVLWQLPGWEPLPLADLLKRKQQELRQQHKAGAA